jgi:DNA-binding NtrC family response regulator
MPGTGPVVLVVDDQPAICAAIELLLDVHGIPCRLAGTPEDALRLVAEEDVGVVLHDMNFRRDATSGAEGVELFRAIRSLDPDLPVLIMTAFSSLEMAVQMIKEGASDYVAKPWDDEKLVATVRNLMRIRELSLENTRMRARSTRARLDLARTADLCGLVYESPRMHEVVSLAVKVARSDVPVLITGPNGSGKERVAQIIQRNSRRRDGPFVKVNAGGLPDELLEAELFGAEPGAYTGARKLRIGRFEEADGGTLFLDEIGNLSAAGQMKLLRVLQTGEYQRLGSNQTRTTNVRILSATNADLGRAIAEGSFREDLYFRLNVIDCEVPPLRERMEDALPLADAFLRAFQPPESPVPARLSREAQGAILAHDWPGNVRELENRIQRAILVGGPEISAADLGLGAGRPRVEREEAAPEGAPGLDDPEREEIERVLRDAQGVVARAAAQLGISRQALYRRMERLGITLERRPR